MRRKARQGKKDYGQGKMISAEDSSSEATKSDGEALAIGMMHLAIASTHVERQSEKEVKAIDKLASLTVFLGSTFKF